MNFQYGLQNLRTYKTGVLNSKTTLSHTMLFFHTTYQTLCALEKNMHSFSLSHLFVFLLPLVLFTCVEVNNAELACSLAISFSCSKFWRDLEEVKIGS